VDALGNLVRFVLLPGQRHDTVGVAPLIEDIDFGALLGDQAFDADWLRAELDSRGATAVIPPSAGIPAATRPEPWPAPPKANRKIIITYHKAMYRWRHLVENFFAKLKEFRAIATRYEKTDDSFRANIHLAAAIIAQGNC
jgi:transposase